ncbi:MAG: hypothetical protein OEY35_03750, partial [Gammaproteobacteria bacterium]|nr:hypothetical protein [Gammaproteobacteria bacterium]
DPDPALASQLAPFYFSLGIITHRQSIKVLTTTLPLGALVGAEKDMVAIIGHGAKDTGTKGKMKDAGNKDLRGFYLLVSRLMTLVSCDNYQQPCDFILENRRLHYF